MDVNPEQLRFTPRTTYYSSFFVLRTHVTIDGEPTEIDLSLSSELTLKSRNSQHSVPFCTIHADLEAVLRENGVSNVGNVFCEDAPLYQVFFSSEQNLKQLLQSITRVQKELSSMYLRKLSESANSDQPVPTADVEVQLYLISPDMVKRDARIDHVTTDNCSSCITLWKESEVFDFDSLFRIHRVDPSKLPAQGTCTAYLLVCCIATQQG